MSIFDIYIRSPINKTAGIVTNNKNCSNNYLLSRDDVAEIKKQLEKKRVRISHILNLNTKTKRKNLSYRLNKGLGKNYKGNEPRIIKEWKRVGEEIQRFNMELASSKEISGL